MKKLLALSLVLFYSLYGFSQSESEKRMPRNFLYAEILGSSYFYSFNYERTVFNKTSLTITIRAGLGFAPTTFISWYTFTSHFIFGRKKHFLEAASGITCIQSGDLAIAVPIMFSWRYHGKKGMFMRIGLCVMPIFHKEIEGVLGWPGFSIGKGF